MIYYIWECKQQQIQIEIKLDGFISIAKILLVFASNFIYSKQRTTFSTDLIEEVEVL